VTPLKPLEAMALRKTCLASDVGGLRELITDGVTGVFFPAGDVAGIVEKILLLSAAPGLRDQLAIQAQTVVRREREWSAIAGLYGNIYRTALSKEASMLDRAMGRPSRRPA
jgi:glycosyltransferase involved in cell wall biosynthesis